jgi:hypothetical protein
MECSSVARIARLVQFMILELKHIGTWERTRKDQEKAALPGLPMTGLFGTMSHMPRLTSQRQNVRSGR